MIHRRRGPRADTLSGSHGEFDQTLRDLAGALLAAAQRGELADAHGRLFDAAEREIIGQAIQLTRGNQLQAARLLGISRLTLREKLTQFGLRPDPQKEA